MTIYTIQLHPAVAGPANGSSCRSRYNIQVNINGNWFTGFCGRLPCTLTELLIALAQAMPQRRLMVSDQGEVTRIKCL